MSTRSITHDAPSLKSHVTGELDNGLALFRGIPYATLEKRWTNSRIRHSLDAAFDATEFAPRCVQGDGPVMVSGGTGDADPGDDEFKCLNLNITVPSDVLANRNGGEISRALPVMVWIHGGAFNYGANSVGRYNPQQLSQLARDNGNPMVLVQINYRLGPLGFAASSDLVGEAPTTDGHPNGTAQSLATGNYGFVDQRNALQWVQDHIGDFGGDPSHVTAFGVSAGSASIHYHILTGSPLFDRAILMSGSAPTLGPLPFKLYEKAWEELCKKCGVQDGTPAQRVERLRALDPMEIVKNYTGAAMGPLADGTLLPDSWSLFEDQAPTRCKSIILGDTNCEGIVVDFIPKTIPQEHFHKHVKSVFSAADAKDFCKTFGFTAENLPYEEYRDAMRFLFSVMMFQYPNLMIAETFARAGSTYLYHFEEPSPYPGPSFGLPYHGQCALYAYQNENNAIPATHRSTALEMGRIWVAFAHGKEPWEQYAEAKRFLRFGPGGKSTLIDVGGDPTRNYGYLGWLRGHFEETKALAQGLLQGIMK